MVLKCVLHACWYMLWSVKCCRNYNLKQSTVYWIQLWQNTARTVEFTLKRGFVMTRMVTARISPTMISQLLIVWGCVFSFSCFWGEHSLLKLTDKLFVCIQRFNPKKWRLCIYYIPKRKRQLWKQLLLSHSTHCTLPSQERKRKGCTRHPLR